MELPNNNSNALGAPIGAFDNNSSCPRKIIKNTGDLCKYFDKDLLITKWYLKNSDWPNISLHDKLNEDGEDLIPTLIQNFLEEYQNNKHYRNFEKKYVLNVEKITDFIINLISCLDDTEKQKYLFPKTAKQLVPLLHSIKNRKFQHKGHQQRVQKNADTIFQKVVSNIDSNELNNNNLKYKNKRMSFVTWLKSNGHTKYVEIVTDPKYNNDIEMSSMIYKVGYNSSKKSMNKNTHNNNENKTFVMELDKKFICFEDREVVTVLLTIENKSGGMLKPSDLELKRDDQVIGVNMCFEAMEEEKKCFGSQFEDILSNCGYRERIAKNDSLIIPLDFVQAIPPFSSGTIPLTLRYLKTNETETC